MIATFEDDDLGSTSNEMRALGDAFCLNVLDYCRKLVATPRRTAELEIVAGSDETRICRAMIEGNFVIMAIHADARGELAILILFAGRHGVPTPVWNGYDHDALIAHLIASRYQASLASGACR